jgi:hypothetical protein
MANGKIYRCADGSGVYIDETQMLEGFVPPSASMNPDATIAAQPEEGQC